MPLDDAFFVSEKLHEQTVTLGEKEHVLNFRELPAVEFIKMQGHLTSSDEDVRSAAMCKLLAKSVCDPDGKLSMTEERALMLTTEALNELFRAVLKSNGKEDEAGNV